MTILVTGAAGFIAFNLCKRLLGRGDLVIGIDDLNSYYSVKLKRDRVSALEDSYGSAFRFITCDFASWTELSGALDAFDIQTIVHLGAQAGVRYSLENPHVYVQSNIVGHINLLQFARSRNVKHFIYASSSSVYGANKKQPFSVEDRVDHPLSLYAATKKSDELMSEAYAHLYRLPQTGLRFFTVYGPWGRPDMAIWHFTKSILAGERITLYNDGNMRRDFTYIDDIVTGIVLCMDKPPTDDGQVKAGGSVGPHRIYNIGNHRSEKLTRMVNLIEKACGREARIDLAPMQPGDVPETFADISAIRRDLGFRPSIAIDEGIPNFVSWYREYHDE